MGHAGMAHALRGLRAPGLPGVSVLSVFENSELSVRPACRAFPCPPCLYSVLSVFTPRVDEHKKGRAMPGMARPFYA